VTLPQEEEEGWMRLGHVQTEKRQLETLNCEKKRGAAHKRNEVGRRPCQMKGNTGGGQCSDLKDLHQRMEAVQVLGGAPRVVITGSHVGDVPNNGGRNREKHCKGKKIGKGEVTSTTKHPPKRVNSVSSGHRDRGATWPREALLLTNEKKP